MGNGVIVVINDIQIEIEVIQQPEGIDQTAIKMNTIQYPTHSIIMLLFVYAILFIYYQPEGLATKCTTHSKK